LWGLFETPFALWKNLCVGEKPDKGNARLLMTQGLYFAQNSQLELAHFCWEQAKVFAHGEDLDILSALEEAIPPVALRPMRNQWRRQPAVVCVHVAPMIATVAGFVWFGLQHESGWQPFAHSDIRHTEIAGTVAWIVQQNGYVNGGSLPRFTTLQHVRIASDPKFVIGQTRDGRTVTVAAIALAAGDGLQARLRWCANQSGGSPYNNELFAQNQGGPNRITVNNFGDYDALAKFVDRRGSVILSFFVAAHSQAGVNNFPDGDYRLEFATGRQWSQICNIFTQDARAQTFPDFDRFMSERTSEGVSYNTADYTITPVPNGNVHAQSLDLESFLSGSE
jgi:hypothetical protein